MDHATHSRLQDSELTHSVLEDATIYGPDDEEISSVEHVHGSGLTAQVVFDVGGFLGIGSKRVALPASQFDWMRDEDGGVCAVTSLTDDQLEELPEHTD